MGRSGLVGWFVPWRYVFLVEIAKGMKVKLSAGVCAGALSCSQTTQGVEQWWEGGLDRTEQCCFSPSSSYLLKPCTVEGAAKD